MKKQLNVYILPGRMNLIYQTMTLQCSVLQNSGNKSGMVAHVWNSHSQEAEAGGSEQLQGLFSLHSECLVSQGYTVRACLKQQNKTDREARAGDGNGVKTMGSYGGNIIQSDMIRN